jgi:hypothetical protein
MAIQNSTHEGRHSTYNAAITHRGWLIKYLAKSTKVKEMERDKAEGSKANQAQTRKNPT